MERQESKQIAVWLYILVGLVFAMTILGGITRLTGSGLSMVTWAPILGWLPPMSQEAWQQAFTFYQSSPEFQEINSHMVLADFKGIFWLEYLHRLLGRLIGVAFLVPFLYFWVRGRLIKQHMPRMIVMLLLGGSQGVMGWYMVKSGLVDVPHVSQYRLTAHLGLGFIIFAYILWHGFEFSNPINPINPTNPTNPTTGSASMPVRFGKILVLLVFVTVLSGALVAGTDAGLTFNTFPLMDGRWFPESYGALQPAWLNPLENLAAIQWDHRLLGVVTWIIIIAFWLKVGRRATQPSLRNAAHLLLAMSMVQVALGIATLLMRVPTVLASAHQGGAMILFGLVLYNLFHWRHEP